jgi:hypothetical protein
MSDFCACIGVTSLIVYIVAGVIVLPISSLILFDQTPIQKSPSGVVYFNKSWPVYRNYDTNGPYIDIRALAVLYGDEENAFNVTVRYPSPPQTIYKKTSSQIEATYVSLVEGGQHMAYIKTDKFAYVDSINLDGWIAAEVIFGIGAGVGAFLILFFGSWGLVTCCRRVRRGMTASKERKARMVVIPMPEKPSTSPPRPSPPSGPFGGPRSNMTHA